MSSRAAPPSACARARHSQHRPSVVLGPRRRRCPAPRPPPSCWRPARQRAAAERRGRRTRPEWRSGEGPATAADCGEMLGVAAGMTNRYGPRWPRRPPRTPRHAGGPCRPASGAFPAPRPDVREACARPRRPPEGCRWDVSGVPGRALGGSRVLAAGTRGAASRTPGVSAHFRVSAEWRPLILCKPLNCWAVVLDSWIFLSALRFS